MVPPGTDGGGALRMEIMEKQTTGKGVINSLIRNRNEEKHQQKRHEK